LLYENKKDLPEKNRDLPPLLERRDEGREGSGNLKERECKRTGREDGGYGVGYSPSDDKQYGIAMDRRVDGSSDRDSGCYVSRSNGK
jgi:hypothetical protein